MGIPHLFLCPISLDLFTDPVTLTTGQTYDRGSIEEWLAGGNSTCPVTMQKLDGEQYSFVPNHTLRHLIDQWLLEGVDCCRSPGGIAASLEVLRSYLQCSGTPIAAKLEALRKVRILSVESEIGKIYLNQLGFFPVLLRLAFRAPANANLKAAELALECTSRLSPSTHLNCFINLLKQDATFASLLLLLEIGSSKIKTFLCLLLEAVTTTTSAASPELSLLLGKSPRLIQILISLLQSSKAQDSATAAAGALAGICAAEENRAVAVKEGAVSGLISYLSLTAVNGRSASGALAALEALIGTDAGRRAAVKYGAARLMVKWVFRVSSRQEGSQEALGVLLSVCRESPAAREEAVAAGVLPQLLLLLQSECSSAAKGRAMALLKVLRSLWVREREFTGRRRRVR
ncbi:U-box domain-containing protein 25 [Apostasia shenzhenica]|uniref:U-box domain-containing protein n=1 Tax=Apostasia shenzhenica TaxID=1088818 RepID=A0A2I0BG82_9ASPA|nr:U-box domain-containing protein 25 [Apostasia shenzhenica]